MGDGHAYDAILIGAGHNALTAGVMLAKAGWKVAVFERAGEVGGAVRTAELTLPGFRHDLFSNTHAFVFISPFYRKMADELREHGLRYVKSRIPVASLFPDGDSVLMYDDLKLTLANLERQSAADAEGWKFLYDLYEKLRENFATLFSSPVPSLAAMRGLAGPRMRLGPKGNLQFVHMLALSARRFADQYFRTDKAKAWFVPWSCHPDFSPESEGSGAFAWVIMGVGQDPEAGMAVPVGGSGNFTRALASLLSSYGGEVHTKAEVDRVILSDGLARGVELADGTRVMADRAVIAGVAPTNLYRRLIGEEHLTPEFARLVTRYRYGLPVLKVDYALSRLPEWAAGEELKQAGLVHLNSSVDQISRAYNQALRGYLPGEPLLIVGQPTAVDPTRAPEGKHILWVIVRSVPYEIAGDADREISPASWDRVKERYADRVADTIERFAPGFKDSILGQHVMSPVDMERENPNLVQGDIGSGSTHLDQSYVFRPFPGWSNYRTPFRRLWLTGASTHPGVGVSTNPGYIVANLLLR